MQVLILILSFRDKLSKKMSLMTQKWGIRLSGLKKKNQEQTVINVKSVCTEVKCIMIHNHSKQIFENIYSFLAD